MTQIDEATLNKVCAAINGKPELHIKLGGSLLPLVSLVVNSYEAARAPRTITRDELGEFEKYLEDFGTKDALATLGITVEG